MGAYSVAPVRVPDRPTGRSSSPHLAGSPNRARLARALNDPRPPRSREPAVSNPYALRPRDATPPRAGATDAVRRAGGGDGLGAAVGDGWPPRPPDARRDASDDGRRTGPDGRLRGASAHLGQAQSDGSSRAGGDGGLGVEARHGARAGAVGGQGGVSPQAGRGLSDDSSWGWAEDMGAAVTFAVLPGGTVHAFGAVISHPRDLGDGAHPAWDKAARRARRLGRPVPVLVGYPDGRVKSCLATADGELLPQRGPQRRPEPRPDPRWTAPAADPQRLREAADAADRAWQVMAAGASSDRLAALLRADIDEAHPHAVLAFEAQAQLALRSGRWDGAAYLCTVAAAARRHARGPAEAADRTLDCAVSAWLRTPHRPTAGVLGFTLAHLVISACPARPGAVAAVLRRLADHLPATYRLTADPASGRPPGLRPCTPSSAPDPGRVSVRPRSGWSR